MLLLVLGSMWGLSFLFIKVAIEDVSPLWVVGARTSFGAAVLLVLLRLRGRQLPRSLPVWRSLLVLATVGNVVPWTLLAWAEESLPSGLASVVNALMPISTLAIAAGVGLERLTTTRVLGLALALGGVTIAVSRQLRTPDRALAVVAIIAATICYGIATVHAKRTVSGLVPPLVVAAGQVGLAAVLSVTAAAVVGPIPSDVGIETAGSLLGLGVLGTGLAFLVFYTLIDRVGATSASMVTYVIPVVGLFAGWAVLDEQIGVEVLAGMLVIAAGIWLAQREALATAREGAADRPAEIERASA